MRYGVGKKNALDHLIPFERYQPRQAIQQWVSLGLTQKTEFELEPLQIDDKHRATTTYIRGQTGTGKSRFMQFLVAQDIRRGHPCALIDPTGSIYRATVQMIARMLQTFDSNAKAKDPEERRLWKERREKFIDRFVFLDFSRDYFDINKYRNEHGYRFNPIYVNHQKGERTSEVVGDFLKSVARMLGSMTETRRLKSLLENSCKLLAESGGCLLDIPLFLKQNTDDFERFMKRLEEREAKLGYKRESGHSERIIKDLLISISPNSKERRDLVQSTINALGVWLSDPSIERLVDCPVGNIDFDDILNNGKILLVHAPLGISADLCSVVGNLVCNKIQRQAYRRNDHQKKRLYTLYGDEFHEYVDEGFAKGAATLRQFGLRCVFAHQDSKQPPFNTEEGRAVLDSIMANATTKIFFRVGPDDAEECVKHFYLAKGNTFKEEYVDITETETRSESWQVSRSISKTISESFSKGTTHTVNFSNGLNVSFSKGEGVTKAQAIGTGVTLTKGEGFSQTRSESTGITVTESQGRVYAINETTGEGRVLSTGGSATKSQNQGMNEVSGVGYGNLSMGGRPGVATSRNQNFSMSSSSGQSDTQSWSDAISNTLSLGKSFSVSQSQSKGRSRSQTRGNTISRNRSESNSRTISNSLSLIENFSRSVGESFSQGKSVGSSEQKSVGVSRGETTGESAGATLAKGFSKRVVKERFNLEEEKTLQAQLLQNLPDRQAIVVLPTKRQYNEFEFGDGGDLNVVYINTHTIEDNFNPIQGKKDYLQILFDVTKPIAIPSVGYENFMKAEPIIPEELRQKKAKADEDSRSFDDEDSGWED